MVYNNSPNNSLTHTTRASDHCLRIRHLYSAATRRAGRTRGRWWAMPWTGSASTPRTASSATPRSTSATANSPTAPPRRSTPTVRHHPRERSLYVCIAYESAVGIHSLLLVPLALHAALPSPFAALPLHQPTTSPRTPRRPSTPSCSAASAPPSTTRAAPRSPTSTTTSTSSTSPAPRTHFNPYGLVCI